MYFYGLPSVRCKDPELEAYVAEVCGLIEALRTSNALSEVIFAFCGSQIAAVKYSRLPPLNRPLTAAETVFCCYEFSKQFEQQVRDRLGQARANRSAEPLSFDIMPVTDGSEYNDEPLALKINEQLVVSHTLPTTVEEEGDFAEHQSWVDGYRLVLD